MLLLKAMLILYIVYVLVENASILIANYLTKLNIKVCDITFMSKLYLFNIFTLIIGCPTYGYVIYSIVSDSARPLDKWFGFAFGVLLFFGIQVFTTIRSYDILRSSMNILNITSNDEFTKFRENNGVDDD
jgi:hypothetical protein